MRISRLFGKTQREIPSEADTPSHQLLIKAGMVQQLTAGVYSYLPLAWAVIKNMQAIIREEMDAAGAQEVLMPAMQPVELWQKSGREQAMGKTLFHVTDRRERTLVLAPTHEEAVTELVIQHVHSYRDLPTNLYHIQTKFRDEPRPRAGLVRVREFIMKDAYTFDRDQAGLDAAYLKMMQAYQNSYARCGMSTIMVEADSGAIGGKESHEFMVPAETGEDTIVTCPQCGYAANAEKAVSAKGSYPAEPLAMEQVATPGMKSIEDVAAFLKIPPRQTLKAVFYVADGRFVFVVIRGDLQVNEIKLAHALKAADLRLASEAEVREKGIVPGAASPVGLKGIQVLADDSVTSAGNLVAGGNKPDTHLRNVNYPRDFRADVVADIALAAAGDACARCGTPLKTMRGIEVGHIFKLGTLYSEKLGAYYTDESGAQQVIVMGCYGMGVSRMLPAAIEQNHDDKGIIWPVAIAPYHVYLCALYLDNQAVAAQAEKLYASLTAAGVSLLFDDRMESPGVKFNDADLLGMPLRITVSPRTLEKSSVELKWRTEKKPTVVPLEGLVDRVKGLIAEKTAAPGR